MVIDRLPRFAGFFSVQKAKLSTTVGTDLALCGPPWACILLARLYCPTIRFRMHQMKPHHCYALPCSFLTACVHQHARAAHNLRIRCMHRPDRLQCDVVGLQRLPHTLAGQVVAARPYMCWNACASDFLVRGVGAKKAEHRVKRDQHFSVQTRPYTFTTL